MIFAVNRKQPVNLDLGTFKYPPMAIASILHRLSGCIIFILTPVMLYFLGRSLHDPNSFSDLQTTLAHPFPKLLLWGFASAMAYHMLAGIRHLLMDLGFGEELKCGRSSSIIVMVLGLILAIVLGIWIW